MRTCSMYDLINEVPEVAHHGSPEVLWQELFRVSLDYKFSDICSKSNHHMHNMYFIFMYLSFHILILFIL